MSAARTSRRRRSLLLLAFAAVSLGACGGGHVPTAARPPASARSPDAGTSPPPPLVAAPDAGPSPAELAARDAVAEARIATAREQQATAAEAALAQAAQQAADAQRMQGQSSLLANARMREVLTRAELRIQEIDEVLAALALVRAGTVEAPTPSALPLCADGAAVERVGMLAASGSQLNWDAAGLARTVEELCGRLQRWHAPDERSRPVIASYVQKVNHIEGWMRDIRGCVGASGRDAARCDNAYGRTQDAEAAEARVIEALMVAHHREIDGVDTGARPFLCTTPTLTRIEGMTFVGSVARAQLPSLVRDAENVCTVIGVSDRALREALSALRSRLDQTEATVRSQRRAQRDLLESLHAQLGD